MSKFNRITETIDHNTGEVVRTERVIVARNNDNSNFIKLFLKDLHLLRGLRAGAYQVTLELLYRMNYENEVIIHSKFREEVARHLGISVDYINHTLKDLVRSNIISKQARGLYVMNPFIFGKGSWDKIRELRIKVKYNESGKADEFEQDRLPDEPDGGQ